MRWFINFLLLTFLSASVFSQELKCQVSIDAEKTGKTQLTVFKTLQNAVEDFVNNTKWSDRNLPPEQRVNCNFFIAVNSYDSNEFNATLQIQSLRPVFGSAMVTPIFNYKENNFNFSYEENQPLNFNPNSFDSNLVSIVSFYAYVILGLDADTFAPNGGRDFFARADQIADVAQQGSRSGWSSTSGSNARYELNNQLRSSNYNDFHQALYLYHRKGLDYMEDNVAEGKSQIIKAIEHLQEVNQNRPNSLLVRSFFDSKASEIADIFTAGPSVDLGNLQNNLNSLAPAYSNQWENID